MRDENTTVAALLNKGISALRRNKSNLEQEQIWYGCMKQIIEETIC